jgi:predicted nucleic acid-binding protein
MSPYDASYVALAEDLGAPLVTTDVRLARAAAGIVPVIVV